MFILDIKLHIKEKLKKSRFLRNIYNKIISQGNSITTKGHNNKLEISGAILKQCSISVNGNNNNVFIDVGCYLQGIKIHMHGLSGTEKLLSLKMR